MDLSPGIEIVWSLAGKEAQIAQMKEIEPEHLFCAVLAFSQMQSAEVMLLEAPMAYKYALIEEIGLVRKSLEEEKINPAQVCEDIRRTLGKGSFPYQGGAVHRSAATRQIFNRASTFSNSSRDF